MTLCTTPGRHFGEFGECVCVCGRCYDRATKKCRCVECCVSGGSGTESDSAPVGSAPSSADVS